jgi:adenosyl cobinamide kinase/adenosyl cobinamide phosphate guanylyltransferase
MKLKLLFSRRWDDAFFFRVFIDNTHTHTHNTHTLLFSLSSLFFIDIKLQYSIIYHYCIQKQLGHRMSSQMSFKQYNRRHSDSDESKMIAAEEFKPIFLVSEEVGHDVMMDEEDVNIELVAEYLLGQAIFKYLYIMIFTDNVI